MPRIIFVQAGARHNYALPEFLYRNDMLQRLYTDFAFGTDGALQALLKLPLPASIRAKLARRAPGRLPDAIIRSGVEVDTGRFGVRNLRRYTAGDIARADGFYLQHFAGGHHVRASAPGKRIVSDVFIVPYAHRTVDAEIAAFPDWGETPIPRTLSDHYERHSRDMFEHSDVLFCPSQAVIDDVGRYDARYLAKCRLVPYGASLRSVGDNSPECGRVLFCGTLGLRKGIQYIHAAAALLRDSHPHIRFVLAGAVSAAARAKLAAPNIEVLGHLGKDALIREFARADVFLFPSLAEGSAGAVLEALASGLPIVGTRAGGVDFTDGASGIIIPPRDPAAIADAVTRICGDRTLRGAMSASALREAAYYSMDAWEARYIAAIRDAF